jgi:hypothetical protein
LTRTGKVGEYALDIRETVLKWSRRAGRRRRQSICSIVGVIGMSEGLVLSRGPSTSLGRLQIVATVPDVIIIVDIPGVDIRVFGLRI